MRQFVIYIGVGIASALIDVGLMQILIMLGVHYVVAASAGFVVSLVANIFLHMRITFSACYSHSMLLRFVILVQINYLITILSVSFFQTWLNMPVLGKIFSLPLVALNGFFLSKYWVYK